MPNEILTDEETSAQDPSLWKAARRRKVVRRLRKRGVISEKAAERQFPRETETLNEGTPRLGKGYPSIGT